MTRMAWRNVLRNWRHSLATILAIASGFTAVSLFDGFLKQIEWENEDGFSTRGMMGHVILEHKGYREFYDEDPWANSLDEADQAAIDEFLKKDPAVQRRVRFLNVTGIANANNINAVVMGSGYDIQEGKELRGERWDWNTVAGKPLYMATGPAILLGRSLGRVLGCEMTDGTEFILPDGRYEPKERPYTCKQGRVLISATTEMAQVNAIDLPISGFVDAGFREIDKRAINMPLADAQRLLDTKKVTLMAVQLKDQRETMAFKKRFEAMIAETKRPIEAVVWQKHKMAAYVDGAMQLLNVFRNLFMVIVVTIGVMSVANTMMKSVNERTREIGTLRSIGFLRKDLNYIFAAEGFFLSLIACALGLVMTLAGAAAVGALGIKYKAGVLSVPIGLKVAAAPNAWLYSTITLSLLATGTAWFCARRASRMVIADAMRHV